MGPLAIGNVKYKTEFGLFKKMIDPRDRRLRLPGCLCPCTRPRQIAGRRCSSPPFPPARSPRRRAAPAAACWPPICSATPTRGRSPRGLPFIPGDLHSGIDAAAAVACPRSPGRWRTGRRGDPRLRLRAPTRSRRRRRPPPAAGRQPRRRNPPVKDPQALSADCRALGVPHPALQPDAARRPAGLALQVRRRRRRHPCRRGGGRCRRPRPLLPAPRRGPQPVGAVRRRRPQRRAGRAQPPNGRPPRKPPATATAAPSGCAASIPAARR